MLIAAHLMHMYNVENRTSSIRCDCDMYLMLCANGCFISFCCGFHYALQTTSKVKRPLIPLSYKRGYDKYYQRIL